MSYFPLLLELSGAPCLVAGGGALGAHKAGLLLDSGADVTVVAPEVCPELAALPVKLLRRNVEAGDVEGMALVVDATGDAAARACLSAACRARHIPFNSACCAEDGSVIFPAVYRQGRTVLAVSSLGASPMASVGVRDALAAHVPERMDEILDAMAALRKRARALFAEQAQRRAFLRRSLDSMLSLGRPLTGAEADALADALRETKERERKEEPPMGKAILGVSFGTAYAETRKKTVEAIEGELAAAFPERRLYTAWTSGMILRKLKKLGEETPDTLSEALEKMGRDGVTDVLVQPTFLQAGYEMRMVRETLAEWKGRFDSITLGEVLVAGPADLDALAGALETHFSAVGTDDALVLMGHGSEGADFYPYEKLTAAFRRDGKENFCVGTVEFAPGIAPALELVQARRPRRTYLAPLMIVAGDHAINDMAGDEPDSWKNRLAALGTDTECILKGLGEYPEVRALFVRHARSAAAL